jgi:hypothetical protein
MEQTILIDGIKYYRQELVYKIAGIKNMVVIYTESTTEIDYMINRLVDYKAKEMANVELKKLITDKVVEFLNLK